MTGRPSRDLVVVAHQQITTEWWSQALPSVDAFISALVLEEIGKGDAVAAARRTAQVDGFPLLEFVPEIDGLAQRYFNALQLSTKASADAYHMALATWHGMDYVVSWNCTHIASGRVQKVLMEINGALELETPILCTPEELMEV